MKILHIVEATFAGVGRHVLDLASAQVAQGDEVHVAYSERRMSAAFETETRVQPAVSWHPVSLRRGPHPSDVSVLRALQRLADHLEIEVVHGHSTKGGLLARLMSAPRRIVVYTPNAPYTMNPDLGRLRRAWIARLERFLSRRTDSLIAVSPEERDHLRALGAGQDRIWVVPNGIDALDVADRDEVRRALGLPIGVPVVGFVGRLDAQKAPSDLLATFAVVRAKMPTARLAIIGTGPLAGVMEANINADSELRRSVRMTGEQPGAWAMSAFDVFLLPSRYEGFPYVLIEANALGLPIVTTTGANATLLAEAGATIEICAVGAIDELAAACVRALAAGSPGPSSGHPFTIDRMVEGVTNAYRSCHVG